MGSSIKFINCLKHLYINWFQQNLNDWCLVYFWPLSFSVWNIIHIDYHSNNNHYWFLLIDVLVKRFLYFSLSFAYILSKGFALFNILLDEQDHQQILSIFWTTLSWRNWKIYVSIILIKSICHFSKQQICFTDTN